MDLRRREIRRRRKRRREKEEKEASKQKEKNNARGGASCCALRLCMIHHIFYIFWFDGIQLVQKLPFARKKKKKIELGKLTNNSLLKTKKKMPSSICVSKEAPFLTNAITRDRFIAAHNHFRHQANGGEPLYSRFPWCRLLSRTTKTGAHRRNFLWCNIPHFYSDIWSRIILLQNVPKSGSFWSDKCGYIRFHDPISVPIEAPSLSAVASNTRREQLLAFEAILNQIRCIRMVTQSPSLIIQESRGGISMYLAWYKSWLCNNPRLAVCSNTGKKYHEEFKADLFLGSIFLPSPQFFCLFVCLFPRDPSRPPLRVWHINSQHYIPKYTGSLNIEMNYGILSSENEGELGEGGWSEEIRIIRKCPSRKPGVLRAGRVGFPRETWSKSETSSSLSSVERKLIKLKEENKGKSR